MIELTKETIREKIDFKHVKIYNRQFDYAIVNEEFSFMDNTYESGYIIIEKDNIMIYTDTELPKSNDDAISTLVNSLVQKNKYDKENVPVSMVIIDNIIYIMKLLFIKEFVEFKEKAYDEDENIDTQLELEMLSDHILYPSIDINKITAGIYSRLLDGLYTVSGFTTDLQIMYDKYVDSNKLLTKEEIEEAKKNNYSVISMNGIVFILKPLTQAEYIDYKTKSENALLDNTLDNTQKREKIIDIDNELIKSHVIKPDISDMYEAGYLETLFGILWTISGFNTKVEVLEV